LRLSKIKEQWRKRTSIQVEVSKRTLSYGEKICGRTRI
jgi:hypothetical protein